MPRVKFATDFHWRPHPRRCIVYKAGEEYLVTRRCKADAEAKGALKENTWPPTTALKSDAPSSPT